MIVVDWDREQPFFLFSALQLRAAFEEGMLIWPRWQLEILRDECRRREHKASVRKLGQEIDAALAKLPADTQSEPR